MDVNQISTDLMNRAGLAEEEQRQLKNALDKKNVPAIIVEDKAGLELSISQLTDDPIGVVRDEETKNESSAQRRLTTDEAKRAILEKYKAKRNSHSILASTYSPIVSTSPKKHKSDAGKLLYASGAHNETKSKRKSWFGKRKRGKNMKPLKKLSKDTRMTILNIGKLNGNRAKSFVTEEETEVPTVIELKKATKTPSRPPNSTGEKAVGRDASFSDCVSTLSHHAYGEGNWAEHGMSSLLNSVLSVGRGKTDKRSPALNDDDPEKKAIKDMLKDLGQDETVEMDSEIFGWESFVDEKTGHTYYQDPITRATTWTSPTKIKTPVSPSRQSNANAATKDAIDTYEVSAANVMLPHIVDAENRTGEEGNTMSGTECSQNDTKRSEGDGETYDDTIGSLPTSRDVTWLELGVSKVLDVSFMVKSGMDEDEGKDDAALEAQKIEASTAQPDAEADNHEDRSIKTSSVLETVKSVPSFSGTPMVNSTEQAESCEKRPTTKANVDKTESLDSTPADSGWFDQGMSSMLTFAGLVAQAQNDATIKSAMKEPKDGESNRSASAPKNTEKFPSIHLVSSIDSPEPAISAAVDHGETVSNAKPARSAPSWFQVDGTFRLPLNDAKKETHDKKDDSGDTLLSDPFKALSYVSEENEKKPGPDAKYQVGRTLTGLTGITGTSVFSGISDDVGSRLLEASAKSMPSAKDEEFQMKPERQPNVDTRDTSKASNKDSQAAPAPSRGRVDKGELSVEDQFKDKTISKETKKSKLPLWTAVFEPSTGRTYYFNRLTHEATWTKPSDFKEKRKPDVYWGAAHKGSTAVRAAIASTANERLVASRKGTDEIVTETTNADPAATLTSDKAVLDKSDTSVEAPTFQDVNVVEYKWYDPVVTLKIQHIHTRKAKPSHSGGQAQPGATERKVVVSTGYTDAVVKDAPPSNSPAEEINDKPVPTRPDIFKERDNPEQARNDSVLKEKKTKRKLLSWHRKRTTEDEKTTSTDSTKDEVLVTVEDERSKPPAVLAPELVAGVEERTVPKETVDYSCVSESEVVEVSNVATSKDVDSDLGGESGFERVLSSVGKKTLMVSISEENPSIDETEKEEDVVSSDQHMDADVVVAAIAEPTRKGPLQLLKSTSQKMLSYKGKERSEEVDAALNKGRKAETPPTASTKPKRKGLLQRLKSNSTNKFADTKTSDVKDNDKEVSLEAKVAKKPKLEEVTEECEKAGGESDVGLARSLSLKKKMAVKARKDGKNTDGKSRKSLVAAAKVKTKNTEQNQAKKVATPEKGVSPTSVLKFVKVSDEAYTVSEEPKPQRPVWKSAVDPTTGRTYYYHRITRQTTWTEPAHYYDPTVESRDDMKEQGSSDRDSVRCKLDDKFAASEDMSKFVVRSVRPMQTKPKIQKAVPSTKVATELERADETTKKSMSASDMLGLSTNLALLKQVADDPFNATLLMRGELEKVAQLFQPEESTAPGSKTEPAVDATEHSVTNSESFDYPDDESSAMAPRDEIRGSLTVKEEPKQETAVLTKIMTAETRTAQHEESTKAGSAEVGKVWEDLLFL